MDTYTFSFETFGFTSLPCLFLCPRHTIRSSFIDNLSFTSTSSLPSREPSWYFALHQSFIASHQQSKSMLSSASLPFSLLGTRICVRHCFAMSQLHPPRTSLRLLRVHARNLLIIPTHWGHEAVVTTTFDPPHPPNSPHRVQLVNGPIKCPWVNGPIKCPLGNGPIKCPWGKEPTKCPRGDGPIKCPWGKEPTKCSSFVLIQWKVAVPQAGGREGQMNEDWIGLWVLRQWRLQPSILLILRIHHIDFNWLMDQ